MFGKYLDFLENFIQKINDKIRKKPREKDNN